MDKQVRNITKRYKENFYRLKYNRIKKSAMAKNRLETNYNILNAHLK